MSNDRACASEEWIKRQRWFSYWRCPLIPYVRIKEADRWNTWSIFISWLVFYFQMTDAPELSADIQLTDMHLGLRLRFLYLSFGVQLPIFPLWLSYGNKLWRKPKRTTDE